MVARVLYRPSVVVVGAAVLWLAVFGATGRLSLDAGKAQLPVAGDRGPLVVRADKGKLRTTVVELRGRVVDAFGEPVVAAELQARSGEQGRTASDGSFAIAFERPVRGDAGFVDLGVTAPGLRGKWQRLALHAPDAPLLRLAPAAPWDAKAVAPEPEVPTLFGEGIVRTFDGKPGVAAFVTVKGTGVWAKADAIGRYVLPLPAGEVELVAHQTSEAGGGLAVRSERFRPERDRGVVPLPDLVAEPAVVLHGRVADGAGVPIVGVPVEVRGDGFSRIVESGLSGLFRLAGLLPGRYEVRPMAFRGSLGRPQTVDLDLHGGECNIAMQPVGERRIRILDEDGHPIPRAHVVASIAGNRCAVAQADTDGWATLRTAGEGSEWEVRSPERYEALPVQRWQGDALLVAQP